MNPDHKTFNFPEINPKNFKDILINAHDNLINLVENILVYDPNKRFSAI